jgi:hypothetical protein
MVTKRLDDVEVLTLLTGSSLSWLEIVTGIAFKLDSGVNIPALSSKVSVKEILTPGPADQRE